MHVVDILLIGAGPSNIAIAVMIEENHDIANGQKVVMLEAGEDISWHRGMMFPEAQSQVSFLKDLVTLRNPTSVYSFLNFLHDVGRLDDFVNLQTFFPYRREISNYLQWCVNKLKRTKTHYNSKVVKIEPIFTTDLTVMGWIVICANGESFRANRLIFGTGRDTNIPEQFSLLKCDRLIHASKFLDFVKSVDPAKIKSIGVIGGAQSSAEVYQESLRMFPESRVTLFMRSVGFAPYGGSKFTNELYSNAFVDKFYTSSLSLQQKLLSELRGSNYAGVTPSMLDSLFKFHYLQRLEGREQGVIYTNAEISMACDVGDEIKMKWVIGLDKKEMEGKFDVVILGTGYKNAVPQLLCPLLDALGISDFSVSRDYRANISTMPGVSLHLVGINEATHGISDTLLSVVGSRAVSILSDICMESTGHKSNSVEMERNMSLHKITEMEPS